MGAMGTLTSACPSWTRKDLSEACATLNGPAPAPNFYRFIANGEKLPPHRTLADLNITAGTELSVSVEPNQVSPEAKQRLAQALEEVKSISRGDLSEVLGMRSPPNGVHMTFQALALLRGMQPDVSIEHKGSDYFTAYKRFLQESGPMPLEILHTALQDADPCREELDDPAQLLDLLCPLLGSPAFEPANVGK